MKKLLLFICFLFSTTMTQSTVYDIVLKGGRVMDPETNFNGVRNVGIDGDRIVEISSSELKGKRIIDVSGLVVAPGFIDLHAHGQTNDAHRYQARDGVTTALELEGGVTFLREWIAGKTGKTIVNFGATVPHGTLRTMAMGKYQKDVRKIEKTLNKEGFDSHKLEEMLAKAKEIQEQFQEDTVDEMMDAFLAVVRNILYISQAQEKLVVFTETLNSRNPNLPIAAAQQNKIKT